MIDEIVGAQQAFLVPIMTEKDWDAGADGQDFPRPPRWPFRGECRVFGSRTDQVSPL
jgi:hypothetical protein